MIEHGVLKQTGLARKQLEDLLAKIDAFVNTLDPAEQAALRGEPHERSEADAVLQHDVSPGRLEAFIKTRTKSGVVVVLQKKG